jgi:hypothetical protein
VQISTANQTVTGTYASGGWVKLDSTNAPGRYRLDLPNDVCAAGVRHAKVMITYSDEGIGEIDIDLVGYDPTATNLPANVTQISGDQAAADNAEAFFDGKGYGPHIISGELDTVNTQTSIKIELPVSGTMTADDFKDCLVLVREANQKGIRRITASSASQSGNQFVDLTLDSALPWNVTDEATYTVLPPDFRTEDRTSLLAVKTKTDFLPSATAGSAGGLFIAGSNAPTTVNVTGNITGSVTGSVGSVNGTTFESIHLDHLFAIQEPGGVVANNSFWAKLLSKSATAAYSDYNNTTDSLQAQRDNLDSVLDGAPTFAEAMDAQGYTAALADKLERSGPTLLVSTTVDGAPSSGTEFTIADGPDNDDALNGALVIVTGGSEKAVGIVRDYAGTSKTVTLVTDLGSFTIADDDIVDIIAGGPVPLWLGSGP